jgi:hypothetical protein
MMLCTAAGEQESVEAKYPRRIRHGLGKIRERAVGDKASRQLIGTNAEKEKKSTLIQ